MKQIKQKLPKIDYKNYFKKDIEECIIHYNAETDLVKKNRIFCEDIYPVFNLLMTKLAHNKINRGIIQDTGITIDDIVMEGITHLYTNCIHNYNPDKGAAFSYFTRSTINFLSKRQTDISKEKLQLVDVNLADSNRDIYTENSNEEFKINLSEFISEFVIFYEKYMHDIYKNDELKITDAVLEIFKTVEQIQIFYKKAIYILIREITGLDTSKITPVIKKIKSDFFYLYNYYNKYGLLDYDQFKLDRIQYTCKPKK